MRTSSCKATGEGKSHSLEQWVMAIPVALFMEISVLEIV